MALTHKYVDIKKRTRILEGSFSGTLLDEILLLAKKICPTIDLNQIRQIHSDIASFFSGSCPEFQKNTLPYHNLRHSQMVVLASARLFHGLHCNQICISSDTLLKGLLAAYFHDTGMLLQEGDQTPSRSQYMARHEARSILFLDKYITKKQLGEEFSRDCATIINYTNLDSDPATFDYHTHAIQLGGQVIGSADILAQMADRYYLELLPLLFKEQETGGINRHSSARELMESTEKFYRDVVLKRLATTFSNISQVMKTHFREMYQIDRNLYLENIDKNLNYLKKIISECADIDCLEKQLKRYPPTT